MTRVTLTRLETGDQGTFGRLIAGDLTFFTGELPWRDNHSNLSCIPPGLYTCRRTFSNHFKRMLYLVEGKHDRLGIRIHPANFMGDSTLKLHCQLNGCIALGEKLGTMNGQKAVLLSAPAVRRFETLMGGKPFELEIV